MTVEKLDIAYDNPRSPPQVRVNQSEALCTPVASSASNHVRNTINQTTNRPSSQPSNHHNQPPLLSSPVPFKHSKPSKASSIYDTFKTMQAGTRVASLLPGRKSTPEPDPGVQNMPKSEASIPKASRGDIAVITKEHRELLHHTMDSLRRDAVMPTREHVHFRFDQLAEKVREQKNTHPHIIPECETLFQAALTQGLLERTLSQTNSGRAVFFMPGVPKWRFRDPQVVGNVYDPATWNALLTLLQRDEETKKVGILKCKNRYGMCGTDCLYMFAG